MNLEQLISACKKNDRTAQNLLFERYKDVLYLTSLKYCRNKADAEDNLHDAFMVIFDRIKTFKSKGSFEGWMKRITMYKAIDKYKEQKSYSIDIIDDLLEDPTMIEDDSKVDLDHLLKLIQELPDQYRFVFNLYQLDGYSHKEVAKILDISESTSKSNYHRAKLLLRKSLNETNVSQKVNIYGK